MLVARTGLKWSHARGKRQPVQTGYGPVGGGVGAPCVSWVLDDRRVVGDNNLDLGGPRGERGRISVTRPSSTSAGGHARCWS
jgi:hypothetical protein